MSFRALLVFLSVYVVILVEGAVYKVAFGSCFRIQEVEDSPRLGKVWNEVAKRNPSVFIWGGDIVYGDYETNGNPAPGDILADLYSRNSELDEYSAFVNLLGKENIVGVWDDHDYGLNNAGKGNPVKEEAQIALLDFFNVPVDDVRRSREGVYSSHYFFDDQLRVILLDVRFHRDTEGGRTGDILGETQWKWLEKELNSTLSSSVRATLIVSGIQILPQDGLKTVIIEIWGDFPRAKERLLRTITTSTAKNVILLSGDVHSTEVSAVRVQRVSEMEYFIPELTSSGMTHSLGTSYGFFFTKILELSYGLNPFEYQYEKLYSFDRNFGEIEFDFGESDTTSKVTLRAINSRGGVAYETVFNFTQLQPESFGENSGVAIIQPVNNVTPLERLGFYILTGAVFLIGLLFLVVSPIVIIRQLYLFSRKRIKRRKPRLKIQQKVDASL